MKKILILPCLMLALTCSSPSADSTAGTAKEQAATAPVSAAADTEKRYQIKSAMIMKTETNSMMKGEKTITTWFDNYGAVEVTESESKLEIMGQKIEEKTWSMIRDGILYTCNVGENKGSKIDLSKTFDAKNIDWSKLSDDLMKQYGIKKAGSEELLGRTCEKWIMENGPAGATATYLVWKNIMLNNETKAAGITLVTKVTQLDENASIPAGKLELPKDVEFLDMTMPLRKQ
jgi:hypothetical protein